MGIFDGHQFDPGTYAPQGNVLEQIMRMQQIAQAPAASQAGPSAFSDQPRGVVGSLGSSVAVPTFGQPDPAQLPQNAQPAQYSSPAQEVPGLGERLLGAVQNFGTGQGGGLISALTGVGAGRENQTVKALVAKGMDPALAQSVARDPGALRAVLPSIMGGGQTNNMKDFTAAQQNPAYQKFLENMKRAGSPNISLDQRGENAFAKTAGETQAKRFSEIVQGGQDAQSIVGDINSLRELGSRITTGKTAEFQAAIGPYAESLGIKVDGLDDMQAYKAIIAKIVPRMRVPGSGTTSDFDMRMFLESAPGLGKTPRGNEIIANTLEATAQHKIKASEIASRAIAGELTPQQAEQELRALPDPLTLWKKEGKTLIPPATQSGGASGGALPRMQSVQDAMKLKPGTRFLDANGVERIR